jgi:phosphonate C-P lyase system protein PhnH
MNMMKTRHSFDMVHGTRKVFRFFLEALANPGNPVSFRCQSAQFDEYGQWLAPALTFLDNETAFFWDGPGEIGEEIRFLSGALPAPLSEADFVFLSQGPGVYAKPEGILAQVKGGSHRNPHDSALLLIASDFSTDSSHFGKTPENRSCQFIPVTMKGPGIPPEGRIACLSPEELFWVEARNKQGFEYPRGVELVFLREDHSILAIPRKVAASWPM